MVSKVAVVALVAILAVPILLGYGLNLTESTKTGYEETGEAVNVTPLLQNDTAYTAAKGTTYQLNTDFQNRIPDYPIYESTSISTKTSLPLRSGYVSSWSGGTQTLWTTLNAYYAAIDVAYSATSYVTVNVYHDSTLVYTNDHIAYVLYERDIDTISFLKMYNNGDSTFSISGGEYTAINFAFTNLSNVPLRYGYFFNNNSEFSDIAAGYHFDNMAYMQGSGWRINLPQKTFNAQMTINLDSITDANYTFYVQSYFKFEKKTSLGGVVSWTLTNNHVSPAETIDLYYNPNITDNTYQLFLEYLDQSAPSTIPGSKIYYRNLELRYVGHWPTLIGEANYYQKYDMSYTFDSSLGNDLDYIRISGISGSRSPTMRVDNASFKAFEFQVIKDSTYTPADFKTNPATTITDITKYGTSLTFGGNQYNVKDGKITINSHDVPINKLVFESVPNENGTYDNKIGNTLISTSAQPSTIKFNGKWAASVVTKEMQQYSYTSTDWTPGQFGWDGIDQNFLMVGLLTAIGAFVALGVAFRKTKAALGGLLVVCGGAILLFFTML